MTEVQFGLLSTVTAIGGLLGTFLYRRIEKRFSASAMMKVCLTLEVTSHLVLGSTVSIPVAFITMFVFGCYAFIWGTISMTTRMRLVPPSLQGRVGSVNMICVIGGVVIGRALGGVIAETWGLRAPFWFAFVGSAITLALIWRELPKIAQAPDAIH